MKKLIFLLLFIFCVSCTKSEEQIVTIKFNIDLIGNPITRVADSKIISALESCMPTIYPLEITNVETGRVYKCNSNETITLTVGEYKIDFQKQDNHNPYFYYNSWFYGTKTPGYDGLNLGIGCDESRYALMTNGGTYCARFFHGPSISIASIVNVNSSGILNINAKLTCGAIVYDNSKIKEIRSGKLCNEPRIIKCFNKFDNFNILFFRILDESRSLYFTLIPNQGYNLVETSFNILQSQIADGYWYFVECDNKEENNYNIQISSPNWSKGALQ